MARAGEPRGRERGRRQALRDDGSLASEPERGGPRGPDPRLDDLLEALERISGDQADALIAEAIAGVRDRVRPLVRRALIEALTDRLSGFPDADAVDRPAPITVPMAPVQGNLRLTPDLAAWRSGGIGRDARGEGAGRARAATSLAWDRCRRWPDGAGYSSVLTKRLAPYYAEFGVPTEGAGASRLPPFGDAACALVEELRPAVGSPSRWRGQPLLGWASGGDVPGALPVKAEL
jgi:hypothetical protein